MCKALERVVAEFFEQAGRGCVGAVGCDRQRVAVGRLRGCVAGANGAVEACAVLHHNRLDEFYRHLLTDEARKPVGYLAWCKRYDKAYRLVRVTSLGPGWRGERHWGEQPCGVLQKSASVVHGDLMWLD